MHVLLRLDPARLWRWHRALIEALARRPTTNISVQFIHDSRPNDRAIALCLQLEQAISRSAPPHPFDALPLVELAQWRSPTSQPVDLIIDLATSTLPAPSSPPQITPLFDGTCGEAAFWAAILAGHAPRLSLHDGRCGLIAIGQPAIESPHALRTSASGVITRLITGLVRAITVPTASPNLDLTTAVATNDQLSVRRAALDLLGRKVASKAKRVIEGQLKSGPQWAVAWRYTPTESGAAARAIPSGTVDTTKFTLLPDDGQRYFADPFLFQHPDRADRIDLFVEELPYATNRGIISLATLSLDGHLLESPCPVLETSTHLSYPHVFARDGAIWMLPEASATGGLTLYRARHYPNDWEPVARLIDEPLHDATLFEHGGKLWISAATEGERLGVGGARWGSRWDSLSLYSADTLLGPWRAHPANPVVIDAKTARPAGELFTHEGVLYRPVQDCSTAYGTATGFARVTTLDDTSYAQDLATWLTFEPTSNISGPHTWNRLGTASGALEAIDLFAPATVLKRSLKPSGI
jgi:hypothetical protein